MSHKANVLSVLQGVGTNLTVKQIQGNMVVAVPQSSVRRILSELKDDGLVLRVSGPGMKTWQAVNVEGMPTTEEIQSEVDALDTESNASYDTDLSEEDHAVRAGMLNGRDTEEDGA